ncbi:hybrid sensor histidine kinase/response regulator transcription factor [Bacteroides oleiciplenus]|uniref:hybrid sensor histidine kinase/response regulator transcription factor n=1 Tax=Bacteroides oleiciplenus TaxID=626931 RepID=UPI0026DBC43B|nr:two-component regulator propeller domain-containing protein [Bacteroides oleiciplenus]
MKYMKIIALLTTLLCILQGQGLVVAQNNPNQYNYLYLTIQNGLCDNSIQAIHKDRNSFMWFGTSNGLDRYDGYELKHYSTAPRQPYQFIESNFINDIDEDANSYLWIASESGIMSIDLLHENLNFYKDYSGKNNNVLYSPVQAILVDDFNNLWIGKSDGLAYITLNEKRQITDIRILKKDVDIKTIVNHGGDIWAGGDKCLLHFTPSEKQGYNSIPVTMNLDISKLTFNCLSSYGDYLWMGTQSGLYCYNTQNQFCMLYQHNPNDPHSISSNFITDIGKNSSGDIIIGTRNGINIYQRNNQFVTFNKGTQPQSLNDNIINRIFVDENDNIWAGANFGGINIMSPQRITFTYALQRRKQDSPNIISTVLEDREGNILAGIVDGGLAIKKKGSQSFSFYKHNLENPHSLAHNNISDIIQDFNGDYWISTIGGGLDKLAKANLSNPIFEHYNSLNSALPSNDIYDIALDSVRNALWICTSSHINTLDFSTGVINRLKYYTQSREPVHNMSTIFIDSKSRLWIGGNGVYVIDLEDSRNNYECIYYQYKLDNPESKINEKITCIFETQKGEIYLGSLGNGIYLLEDGSNAGKYKFMNYAVRCGLSDTSISNILDDKNGNLWISTLKGVYFFDITTKRAFKFDEGDGLLVPQFYKRSGCKAANHNMLLGTIDGFVTFSPLVSLPRQKQRTVTLTSAVCDGKQLIPYLDSDNLPTSISTTKELHLYPPQNSFEITFSCLDYLEQEKVFYSYRILELKENRNIGLVKRNAKYTNLSPGKYTLEIQCTNHDNTWSTKLTTLSIIVHPPFYKTTWFYSLIAILIISILIYIVYSYNARQKHIQRLLKEKIEVMSQQMEAINKEKLSYFTNLAHEFKTPLTLIQGPASQLMNQVTDPGEKEDLQIINRNAQYLLSLVNQLIDLRKIDTKNLTLNSVRFNFSKFLDTTIMDFSNLMKERNIQFEKIYRLKSDHIYSDKENLHKILFNLLSNAIKHTPDKGKITVHANQFTDKSKKLIQFISVTNSGSTIAPDEVDKIFNRFYRIPDQNKYTSYGQSSTGIGLHIVKEITTLLGGTIKVKSSEDAGVSFRLHFPITLANESESEAHPEEYSKPVPVEDKIEPFIPIDRSKPTLLLVEDNPDMRHYIKNMLKEKYNIAEANNGEQGYKAAQNIMPDFIVSDLMMPVCDGADFCKRIREDKLLCHIPFLLLTANSSENARIESYENGVDGYITKPFEESVLLANIDSILKNRDLRQKKFVEQDLDPILLEVGQPDQQFMNDVMDILEKNYANPDFGVKELTDKLNISYTVIYKKFISLTGLPPVRFLQLYRLQIAKKILENSTNNVIVSEIAYRVGFNDPKYFTRCFVKQYKKTPSSFFK